MAIAAVTVGAASETTAQTIECPAPGSIVDDNYLRIIAVASDDVNISMGSAGWTTVGHIQMTIGQDGALAVFIKKAATESGTYTVNIDGGVDKSIAVVCSQFSGVDLSTPQDATATSTTDQTGTSYDPAAITTTTANAYVETCLYARGTGLTTPSQPSGYTVFGADKSANKYMAAAHIDAGSIDEEDPGVWTTFTVSASCMGITWAMKPSGASGSTSLQTHNYQGMNRLNGGHRS